MTIDHMPFLYELPVNCVTALMEWWTVVAPTFGNLFVHF